MVTKSTCCFTFIQWAFCKIYDLWINPSIVLSTDFKKKNLCHWASSSLSHERWSWFHSWDMETMPWQRAIIASCRVECNLTCMFLLKRTLLLPVNAPLVRAGAVNAPVSFLLAVEHRDLRCEFTRPAHIIQCHLWVRASKLKFLQCHLYHLFWDGSEPSVSLFIFSLHPWQWRALGR